MSRSRRRATAPRARRARGGRWPRARVGTSWCPGVPRDPRERWRSPRRARSAGRAACAAARARSRRRARPRGSRPARRRRRAPGAATARVELASIRQYRGSALDSPRGRSPYCAIGMSSLRRYAAAISHLGPRQTLLNVVCRARRRTRRFGRYRRAGRGLEWTGRAVTSFLPHGGGTRLAAGHFTAIGRTLAIGDPPRWDAEAPLLWLFNLHYFAWLDEVPANDQERLRPRLDRALPTRRAPAPGWWPYPLSLRLRHWTPAVFRGLFAAEPARTRLLASIEAQAECLTDTLEVHLRGNHLLESALTLKLLAACFRGPAVSRWERRADAVLDAELGEQFLPGRRPRRALAHVPRAAPARPPRPRQRAARDRRAAGAHPGAAARSPPLPGRHAPPGRRDRPLQRRGLRDRAGAGRSSGLRSATRRRSARVRIGLLPGHGLPRLAAREQTRCSWTRARSGPTTSPPTATATSSRGS